MFNLNFYDIFQRAVKTFTQAFIGVTGGVELVELFTDVGASLGLLEAGLLAGITATASLLQNILVIPLWEGFWAFVQSRAGE